MASLVKQNVPLAMSMPCKRFSSASRPITAERALPVSATAGPAFLPILCIGRG